MKLTSAQRDSDREVSTKSLAMCAPDPEVPQIDVVLADGATRRRLVIDTIQHPAILLPLAAFAFSVIYLLLFSPVFGGGTPTLILATIFGIAAVASFLWWYGFRYQEAQARILQVTLEIQDQEIERLRQIEIAELRDDLQAGLSATSWPEGMRAAERLERDYDQLQLSLQHSSGSNQLAVPHIFTLARETYWRGLSVLSDALELMKASHLPDRSGIEAEIHVLEEAGRDSGGCEGSDELLAIQKERLAFYRQRLELLDRLDLSVGRLLVQAERCDASLHRASIELAAIRSGSSESSVDAVVHALQGTIERAKEVQEELKRIGF